MKKDKQLVNARWHGLCSVLLKKQEARSRDMILNTSDNNVKTMESALRAFAPDCVVMIDYADNIQPFLDFFAFCEKSPKFFFITENKPSREFLKNFKKSHVIERHWSFDDYRAFFFGRPRVYFHNHQAVYEGDTSRLAAWRKRYAMGPFFSISERMRKILPFEFARKIADGILAIMGMIIQIIIPSLRKKSGRIDSEYKGKKISIYFDGSPEKDHYGESPIISEKLKRLEKTILSCEQKKIGFFIGSGPRHTYIEKILDLEEQGHLNNFFIFAGGLFRPKTFEVTKRRKTGCFLEGSNKSMDGRPIYSDHCLSIGAGEKEIWYYSSLHNSDPHEKE